MKGLGRRGKVDRGGLQAGRLGRRLLAQRALPSARPDRVGRPVVATLRSKDVIHSFFLPEFRVKQDAVPGMSTRIWFDGLRTARCRS